MLPYIPAAGRDRFLADITNAEISQTAGVESSTHAKCDLALRRWLLYLQQLGLPFDDPFLSTFSEHHRIVFLCAFMQYIWDGNCSRGGIQVKAATCREAVDYVAQKFKSNSPPDPRLDASGNISIIIVGQTKGIKNADPAAQHEKALPVSFYGSYTKPQLPNLTTRLQ